jgi:hypothetical protein
LGMQWLAILAVHRTFQDRKNCQTSIIIKSAISGLI